MARDTARRGRSPRTIVKRIVIIATVSVVVGTGGVVYAMAGTAEPSYRTAKVSTGPVDETLDATGTVDMVDTAELNFSTSGKVGSVAVAVGDKVTTGQHLAKLDTTALDADADKANATLKQAEATLQATKQGQVDQASGNSPSGNTGDTRNTPNTGSGSTGNVPSSGDGSGAGGNGSGPGAGSAGNGNASTAETLRKLQDTVITAQRRTDQHLTQARSALAAQQRTCAAAYETTQSSYSSSSSTSYQIVPATNLTPSPSPTPTASTPPTEPTNTPTATPTPSPSPTPSESPSQTPNPSPSPSEGTNLTACETALKAVQSIQEQVAKDQQTLQSALASLATALDTATAGRSADGGTGTGNSGSANGAGQAGTGSATTPSAQPSPSANSTNEPGTSGETNTTTGNAQDRSGGSSSSGSGADASGQSKAARLAGDQASIDKAEASLLAAKDALAGATLVAPFSGTVARVGFAKGDGVDTSSSILILGDGGATVKTSLTEANTRRVKVGMSVRVRPDGATDDIEAKVVSIGLLPSTSSTGTTTYPVTIGVINAPQALRSGSQASVSVRIGHVDNAVTVPSSAVTRTANGATVRRYTAGKVQNTSVKTGIIGPEHTQITDGLKAGDRVVLADLSAAIPTSETSNTTGRFGSRLRGGFNGPPTGGSGGPTPRYETSR